jgi:hypothetical protein
MKKQPGRKHHSSNGAAQEGKGHEKVCAVRGVGSREERRAMAMDAPARAADGHPPTPTLEPDHGTITSSHIASSTFPTFPFLIPSLHVNPLHHVSSEPNM